MHTPTPVYMYTRMDMNTNTYAHTYAYLSMHPHTYACTYMYMDMHKCHTYLRIYKWCSRLPDE